MSYGICCNAYVMMSASYNYYFWPRYSIPREWKNYVMQ